MASPPADQPAAPVPPDATPTPTPCDDDEDISRDNDEIPARASPSPDLPLTMTASLVLTSLPRDAAAALARTHRDADDNDGQRKIVVRFKPVGGSAPPLPQKRELSRVSAGQKFEVVVAYLNRVLRLQENKKGGDGGGQQQGQQQSVFCYVNATFAPALDEVVGNLWRVSCCFCCSTPLARGWLLGGVWRLGEIAGLF